MSDSHLDPSNGPGQRLGGTLGDRLAAVRAQGSPSRPPLNDPRADRRTTTRAVGAAMALMATMFAAIAFAWVLSRMVGGVYITFLTPMVAGMLIAALASIGPRRFGFGDRRALTFMMIGGATVAWVGQHLLAYLRVVDLVAARGSGGGAEAGLALIEHATGGTGFMAYLDYVSGLGAELSPVGYLGRLIGSWGLGTAGTIGVAVVELGLMIMTARWSMLYRTRGVRVEAPGPLGWLAPGGLDAFRKALAERRWSDAAGLLWGQYEHAGVRASHVVEVREGEVTAHVEVFETDPFGGAAAQVAGQLLPIEALPGMRDAVGRSGQPGSARPSASIDAGPGRPT
jgi:hypothetical protein